MSKLSENEHLLSPEELARARELAWHDANDRTPEGIPQDNFRMVNFIDYDPVTGRINGVGYTSIASLTFMRQQEGRFYIEGQASLDGHYVDLASMEVRPRTPCPAYVDGLFIRKLPVPCRVVITDESNFSSDHQVDAIEAELEFDDPGTYTVQIYSVKHFDGLLTVVVP